MPEDRLTRIPSPHSPYRVMIGTGGVGSGTFFALAGNETLGREESRAGHFLDRKDYCKLHIISHYVKVLLGSDFEVIPASKVGDDATGRQLIAEMKAAGLSDRYLEVSPGDQTLFSLCFLYPDGSGGNLTAADAANEKVDAQFIAGLEPEFALWHAHGIALAAPEVPMEARLKLLELASQHAFLRVSALTSQEARTSEALAVIERTDLLALNLEEAAALAGQPTNLPVKAILEAARQKACKCNSQVHLSITAGKAGSWCWDERNWTHTPSIPVAEAGTAGAGDAHLAGIIAGLAAGLPLPLAQQLGTLTAACSITSPDTINKDLDRAALAQLAHQQAVPLDPAVIALIV